MAWTQTQADKFLAALLALLEAKQGMVDRAFLARQARLMFDNPDKAHYLLSQRELKHYERLLRN